MYHAAAVHSENTNRSTEGVAPQQLIRLFHEVGSQLALPSPQLDVQFHCIDGGASSAACPEHPPLRTLPTTE